jgi:hypothetical protein
MCGAFERCRGEVAESHQASGATLECTGDQYHPAPRASLGLRCTHDA